MSDAQRAWQRFLSSWSPCNVEYKDKGVVKILSSWFPCNVQNKDKGVAKFLSSWSPCSVENKDKSALTQCRSVYRHMYSIPLGGSLRWNQSVLGVVVLGGVAVVNIVSFVSDEQLVMKRSTLMLVCAYVSSPQTSDTCRRVLHVSSEVAPSAPHSARKQTTYTCTATLHVLFTYFGDSCHTLVTYRDV